MSCGVVHTCSLDLALLWLWRRVAAVALIKPLAWEPPYAMKVALKSRKKKKKEEEGLWPFCCMSYSLVIPYFLHYSLLLCLVDFFCSDTFGFPPVYIL